MDLHHLRAFVAIAELRHFGRAAAWLNITQPALTKRIRAMEDLLGARLFERDRRGTMLTRFGELLLPDASRITVAADDLRARARRAVAGEWGRLDVGFGLSAIELAPRLVARYRTAHPDVTVSLNNFSSAEQIERLTSGTLDLGFLRLPPSGMLATRPLFMDRLAIARPFDMPFDRDMVSLNRTGFVMLESDRGPGLSHQIAGWCHSIGFIPRVVQRADDIQTVLALVAGGVGYSILPYGAGKLMNDSVRLEPIDDPAASWTIGMAWRSDRQNPALRNFIAVVDKMGIAGLPQD
ncbi:MAG: LysR family transcriptional regulator [Pseudomonadota bacterium]